MKHNGLMLTKLAPATVWASTNDKKHVTEFHFHSSLQASMKFKNTKESWFSPLFKMAQVSVKVKLAS